MGYLQKGPFLDHLAVIKRVSVCRERWSSETKMPLNMSSSKVIKDVIFFGEIREKFAKWVGLFGKIIEHFPGFFWSAP